MPLTNATDVIERQRDGAARAVERRAVARLRLTVEAVAPEVWDRLAAGFDGIVQEQTYTYAAARWPSAIKEALLFRLGADIVGGAIIMVQPLPLRLGAIAACKWGPVFKDAGRADIEDIYDAMIDALVAEYATARRMTLSVSPRAAAAGHGWQLEHLRERRFRCGASLPYPNRYFVKLGLPDDEQRRSLGQKWRYHLGKAENANLSFERAEPGRVGEFDALYAAMADRKNFPDLSAYETIRPLLSADVEALRPALFFVRQHGEAVAAALVFTAGDTAVYLFGATNDEALPLRAGYFLHWGIISWLRDNSSAKWYDLGGTDGFMGLHQFKKGMVGSSGTISPVPPVGNYARGYLPMLIGGLAFGSRTMVHRCRWHLGNYLGRRARPDQPRPRRGQTQ